MTLLNDSMTILARAQTLAAFIQKYGNHLPTRYCSHQVGPEESEEHKPRVTFYADDLYSLGLIFGVAGWERQMMHLSDFVEFIKEVAGVTVYVFRVELCNEHFEGRQPVTPEEFEKLAKERAPLATAQFQQEAA